jgi:hypothetical protein
MIAGFAEAAMNKSSAKDRPRADGDALPLRGKEAKRRRKRGVVTKLTNERRQTTSSQAEKRVPRLPHERDESADSQGESGVESPDAAVSRQAYEDVERGLINTDQGLEGSTVQNGPTTRRNDKYGNT